jgi:hypothetical protein
MKTPEAWEWIRVDPAASPLVGEPSSALPTGNRFTSALIPGILVLSVPRGAESEPSELSGR